MSELSSRVEVLENRMTQASRIILDMTSMIENQQELINLFIKDAEENIPILPPDELTHSDLKVITNE
tara:strand:- start:849 stop:1049 length:201 start_codon:yes stop_codon:yes gene_type:complete